MFAITGVLPYQAHVYLTNPCCRACMHACMCLCLCVQMAFCCWLTGAGPLDLQGVAFVGVLFFGYMGPNMWTLQLLKVVCPLA
jgi:hypothetical protein